jgi:2,3-diketo-5-methylthio-1-phosphopentane phosphatase
MEGQLNQPAGRVLVTDFDGSITDHDIYKLIAERYMPRNTPEYFEGYRRGVRTHFEAMNAYFSHAPADEEAWEKLLEDAGPDPQLADGMDLLRRAGWEVIVASAGSSWYIDRILAAAGVQDVAVHASPGTLVKGGGLVMRLPAGSPFFSREVGIDKAVVVRDALSRAAIVAFAGDGPPDVEPAMLVDARRRFARGWLADELRRRGTPFREFVRWYDVAHMLSATP